MKKHEKCSIPACQQDAKVSGMCGACYSWWNRIQFLTASELSRYLHKLDRFASRRDRLPFLRRGVMRRKAS